MTIRRYHFGPFRLDPHTLELHGADAPIPLEPLPARLLVRLIERAGEMVGRSELRELGWPDLPDAAEQSLNTAIGQIRHALDDDASHPRFLETLRGRGYRFVAPVTASSSRSRYGIRWTPRVAGLAAATMVAMTAMVVFAVYRWRDSATPVARVVVTQPEVVGVVSDADVLGDVLAEELRIALAMVSPERIRVLGRASTRRRYDSDLLARSGRTLLGPPATHRLQVIVRPATGDTIGVIARLVDAGEGGVVWGGGIETTPADLRGAANTLARKLTDGMRVAPRGGGSVSPEVPLATRSRLLKARYLFEQFSDLPTALAMTDSLIAVNPTLADAHGLRAELLLFLDEPVRATDAAYRALDLDPTEPAGRRALAGVRMLAGEWRAAEGTLRDVLTSLPNDPATLSALAFLFTAQGRFAEAGPVLQHALDVDPLSPLLAGDIGLMYFWAGRFDDAERACRETVLLRPDAVWAMGCRFDALLYDGRVEPAATQARRIFDRYHVAQRIAPDAPADSVIAAYRGWQVDAWERVTGRDATSEIGLALAYAETGRSAEAIDALERAAAAPTLSILTIGVDPRLRSLSGEPRYHALLDKFNLPAVQTGRPTG